MTEENISEEEINQIRNAIDKISWTLLNITKTSKDQLLRINYLNKFLIESFNWFCTDGLKSFFENREFEIEGVGIIKITDHRIDYPRQDELGNPNALLWPNQARMKELNYSGTLLVKVNITWFEVSGKSSAGTVPILDSGNEFIPIGKFPIMLGSVYDNLSSLQTEEDLVEKEEDCDDYLGYFIINGNQKVLVTQNFSRENTTLTKHKKIKSKKVRKLICSITSRGPNWRISEIGVFLMTLNDKRLMHSDRRIYMNISISFEWNNPFQKNIYKDKDSIVGINIINVFRLCQVLLYKFDPTLEDDAYLFTKIKGNPRNNIPDILPGFRGKSTYSETIAKFLSIMKSYTNEKLWSKIADYILDTVNEASLEEDESVFINNTIKVCMNATEDGKYSLITASDRAMKLFARSFMPHCSRTNFWFKLRSMKNLKEKVRGDIVTIIENNTPELLNVLNEPRPVSIAKAIKYNILLLNHVYYNLLENEDESMIKFIEILAQRKIFITKIIHPVTTSHIIRIFSAPANIINLDEFKQRSSEISAPINDPSLVNDKITLLTRAFHLFDQKQINTNEFIKIEKVLNNNSIYLPINYLTGKLEFISIEADTESRLNVIAYMAIRLLRTELGYENIDDRDSLAQQEFRHPGGLMMSRFSSMFRTFENDLKKKITYESSLLDIVSLLKATGDKEITEQYSSNFSNGKWNAKGAKTERTGVTDSIKTTVTLEKVYMLRKLSKPSDDNSKNTATRDITGLQGGAMCLSETPEGPQCGNITSLASAAFITNESFDSTTLAYRLHELKTSRMSEVPKLSQDIAINGISILAEHKYISDSSTPERNTPFFLDGKFIGWVQGLTFRKLLINMRRNGFIHPHSSVTFKQAFSQIGAITELKVNTSAGRIVQPLIIAEDSVKLLDFLRKLTKAYESNPNKITVETMIESGFVEFVDTSELEFLDISPSVDIYLNFINDGLDKRYDHIMLNPAFLLGISANAMPLANMNPIVRNAYFTAQVKQPVVTGAPILEERAFKSMSRFQSHQDPLIYTSMYDHVLKDDPFGINVDILITTHKFGEEDGIIINKRLIDLGGFSSTSYTTFKMDVSSEEQLIFEDDFMEKIEDPSRYGRGIIRTTKKVVKTDKDGKTIITTQPVVIKPLEILARKIQKGADGLVEAEYLKFDSLREGVIDRILWNKTSKNTHKLAIVVKMQDNMILGDKLTSRFAQKGVITLIVPPEDLPFDQTTGKTPDLIINPQALPSRMTVGQIAELFAANSFILPDKNKVVHILYVRYGLDIFVPLVRLFVVNKIEWKNYSYKTTKIREIEKELYTVISSEIVTNQETMDWLKENDIIAKDSRFKEGLWGIKIFAQDTKSPIKYFIVLKQNQNLQDLQFIPKSWIEINNKTIVLDQNIIVEDIPGLWFDTTSFDPDDEEPEFTNPLRGIRLSKLPENIRKNYLMRNTYVPVADQCIAGYRDSFFTVGNLNKLFLDFIIPDNMRTLVVINEQGRTQSITLPLNIKYSDLRKMKDEHIVTIEIPRPDKTFSFKNEKMSVFKIWNRRYNLNTSIPKDNVVKLPEEAKDLFELRTERIKNLREATVFKKTLDVNDAIKELEMMGYQADGKRVFVNGKTGEVIKGGLVSGWTYYMALKHKVKNKMQARGGYGKVNALTRGPLGGRTRGGGMKFNLMDALAAIKSNATAVVSDRMLDSSGKQEVFVCTKCNEFCYTEKSRAIICPICRSGTTAIRTSVPYMLILERNLLMGAGIRPEIDAVLENETRYPEHEEF